ncbi:MAG: tetratricopeptide repeat protein [Chloracidobacterium sp.]|nr:tetratricopeptide repeat protein [Chloracidobacterium sp.]
MRETLSKRQKGKAKNKVASTKVSSKLVSDKKKELKMKPAPSHTASGSKQRKISTAKVARKVAKNPRIKKASKKSAKTSLKKPTPKTASRPARTQKKIVAKTQKKVVAKKQDKSKPLRRLPIIVSQAPPPPEPPRRQVTSGALRAFEQAVKVFNRRRFDDAKAMFESLLSKFPGDLEIVARTQMYIQVCKQKLEQESKSSAPHNADELYDHGVFALNIGDFTQARAFFEKALRLHPDEPHLLYSLAATHAQSGSPEEALNYLKRSIQIQPRFRTQAYNDADFSGLRDNRQFLELVGLTSPFDRLDSRR